MTYLGLGHVFVANMTGNVVFLGFAVADAQDFSIRASLVALAAFLVGAVVGGRLGAAGGRLAVGGHRGRLLARATALELLLVAGALAVALSGVDRAGDAGRDALIALLGLPMGLQSAVARRLAVPDLTTTVLTMTLTGLAADSALAGGRNAAPTRRLLAVAAILAGAASGGVIFFRVGFVAVLTLTLGLLAVTAVASFRLRASPAGWAGR